ncbi:hypothetical protein J5N97_010581 [Dioscorea zingiberensis]|uniref:Methylenetetrahydrofolate reductase n=1 Tax=Dioscorea zingiberensis TaxID=325984 RepID=A0A9D5CZ06_9LILI|nr:hypothetical protein J5N97_010581 [Dioscorea zingiberensis]
MQALPDVETNLHLTSLSMPLASNDARAAGIRNILTLLGDPLEKPDNENTFISAINLARHIRTTHDDYFYVTVKGYPGLPLFPPKAGANLIITQLFFDASIFLKFLDGYQRIGIKCPIIPGILSITTYRTFMFMTATCKMMVSPEVREKVEELKRDNTVLG